jgi:hypothetical protein
MSDQEIFEQRAHKRHRTRSGAFAVIKNPDRAIIGEIIDISKGGLAFKYMENGGYAAQSKMDILFSGHGLQIKGVPFKSVSDVSIKDFPAFSSIRMRRGSIQFIDLEKIHTTQLNLFIEKYTFSSVN